MDVYLIVSKRVAGMDAGGLRSGCRAGFERQNDPVLVDFAARFGRVGFVRGIGRSDSGGWPTRLGLDEPNAMMRTSRRPSSLSQRCRNSWKNVRFPVGNS